MRIGSRQAAETAAPLSRATATAASFGAGVGAALSGLASAFDENENAKVMLANAEEERRTRLRRASTDTEFIRWQGERTREVMERQGNAPVGAAGLTDQTYESLGASFEEFASRTGLDPEESALYRERFESFRQSTTTQVFAFEFEESNRALGNEITGIIDLSRQEVYEDPALFEDRYQRLAQIIDESPLPPAVKEQLEQEAYNQLATTLFSAKLEASLNNQTPTGPATGENPVAPGLSPIQRGILNAIAKPESNGDYFVRYGGTTQGPAYFTDISDHPRIFEEGPHGPSSAAGRYQITATTWDRALRDMRAAGYEIDGTFSPLNQDRVALFIAEQEFLQQTGIPLAEAAANRGQLPMVREVLAGLGDRVLWAGLDALSDDEFANIVLGGRGLAGGGTGDSPAPDLYSDPRFDRLPFDMKLEAQRATEQALALQRQQRADAAQAETEALYNSLRVSFSNLEANAIEQAEAAIASGRITDAAQIEKLRSLQEEELGNRRDYSQMQSRVRNGEMLLAEDGPALDIFAQRSGILEGIQSRDTAYLPALETLMLQNGALPANVVELLSRQFVSPDPAQQMFAMDALASLWTADSRVAASVLGEKAAEQAALAASLLQFTADPRQALAQANILQQPESAPQRRVLREQAEELLLEQGSSDFLEKMTSWWERNLIGYELITGANETREPGTPAENFLFQSEFREQFTRFYTLTGGNEEAAMDAAAKVMSFTYSPNPNTGELMKHSPTAPQMGVPTFNNSYQWIDEAVRRQAGIAEDAPYSLVADAQTLRDRQTNGAPTYTVIVEDPVEGFKYLPDRVEVRLSPLQIRERNIAAQETNIRTRIEQLEGDIRRGNMALPRRSEPGSRFGLTFSRDDEAQTERRAEVERLRRQLETLRVVDTPVRRPPLPVPQPPLTPPTPNMLRPNIPPNSPGTSR